MPKKNQKAEVPAPLPVIRFGGMVLTQLAGGSLWLTNGEGEGMEIKPGDQKFERCLRRYFDKHF